MIKSDRKVIFVVGSTATGKSEWALRLAQEFNGVVVNCDSIQLYKYLDIGAAKPSKEERSLVPHYLFDYVLPPQEMTAGQYHRDFFATMDEVPGSGPVFVVGGTGFYFMAIEKGMYSVPPVPEEIQKQIAAELAAPGGPEKLHQELLEKDPDHGAKIHLSDHYRIGRALELMRSQGKTVTQIQKEFAETREEFPFPLLKIGPSWDREVLKNRIDLRTEKMLQQGLVAEVKGLLDQGLETWAPMSSVGYKETIAFLKGEISSAEMREQISTNTRQLAKRQKTWFQRDKDIHWFDGAEGFPEARNMVENFLNS